MTIFVLGYGSLIWDLDDLAPKVRGDWRMGGGPALPLEFSRISPKRLLSLVVVIDPAGDPCPTHAIKSIRTRIPDAVADLAARERAPVDRIGWVDAAAGTHSSHHPAVAEAVRAWCEGQGASGAVWTDLDANFEAVTAAPFTVERGIDYLKTLEGESLAAALQYIDGAPAATDTPLRRALSADPWWRNLRTG